MPWILLALILFVIIILVSNICVVPQAVEYVVERLGIYYTSWGAGLHFKAAHLHKYYAEALGQRRGLLPDTEWNSDRICSLPLFPDMVPEDVDDVVAAIKEILA